MTIHLFFIILALGIAPALAQKNYLITSNSAGGVKIGMTVSQARKALTGCRLTRGSDGEGIVLIAADCRGKQAMTFYAGEEDFEARINEKAKIQFIEVWDPRFRTPDGIHQNMLVSQAEKLVGKVTKISLTEIESREFVEFTKKRKNIAYRIYGGIYSPRETTTSRFEPGTRLHSIQVRSN